MYNTLSSFDANLSNKHCGDQKAKWQNGRSFGVKLALFHLN